MLLMKGSQLFGCNDEKGTILLMIRAIRDRFPAPPQRWEMIARAFQICRAFLLATIYSQL
jgi:hypothetical protein